MVNSSSAPNCRSYLESLWLIVLWYLSITTEGLGKISCLSMIRRGEGLCNGLPLWYCCVNLKNKRSWNVPCSTLEGSKYYCVGSEGDATRTIPYFAGGGGRS